MSSRDARLLIRGRCPHCGDEIIIILDKTQAKHIRKAFKMNETAAKAYLGQKLSPILLAPAKKRDVKPPA